MKCVYYPNEFQVLDDHFDPVEVITRHYIHIHLTIQLSVSLHLILRVLFELVSWWCSHYDNDCCWHTSTFHLLSTKTKETNYHNDQCVLSSIWHSTNPSSSSQQALPQPNQHYRARTQHLDQHYPSTTWWVCYKVRKTTNSK